jgi:hypothetical protein
MKTTTLLTAFAASVGLSTAATAQMSTFVAGWDMSQFGGIASNYIDLSFSTPVGQLSANYSDYNAPFNDANPASAAFGTYFFNGQNGASENPGLGSFVEPVKPTSTDLTGATSADFQSKLPPNSQLGSSGNLLALSTLGQEIAQSLGHGISADFDLVFAADLSSVLSTGEDWSITFAMVEEGSGDSADLEVSASTDASAWFSLGTAVTSDVPTAFTFNDAGGALDGSDAAYFRISLTGVDGTSVIDNVGISAAVTVIPEPSAVGLLGLVSLMGVAFARRRR